MSSFWLCMQTHAIVPWEKFQEKSRPLQKQRDLLDLVVTQRLLMELLYTGVVAEWVRHRARNRKLGCGLEAKIGQ